MVQVKMKKLERKMAGLGFLILMAGLFLIINLSFISSVFNACFDKGEMIKYCNPDTNINRCGNSVSCRCESDWGCSLCMGSYNATRDCYNQGGLNACNNLQDTSCTLAGNGTVGSTTPNMTINSPKDDWNYSSKSVNFNIHLTEYASIYYKKASDSSWTRLCQDCINYNGQKTLSEGANNLMFKAVASGGSPANATRTFFVDSKKPSITKVLPQNNAFTRGTFHLEFKELNTRSIVLFYGNKQTTLNFSLCAYNPSTQKYFCDKNVDLSEFNGQQIAYWFNVTDRAGNSVKSSSKNVKVDLTSPVVNNPLSFWRQNGRDIYFNMSITEANLYKVEYKESTANNWMTLCSTLSNGMCAKKKTFSMGAHNVDILIRDKAGNNATLNLIFSA